MSYSDGQPQPQRKRPTDSRKGESSPIRIPGSNEREPRTQASSEDEIDIMETRADFMDNPPRPSSSAIRRGVVPPTPRTTSAQNSPIPPRRTGQPQPTAAFSAPVSQQPLARKTAPSPSSPRTPRNTTRNYPPDIPPVPHKRKVHWLLPVGVGMIAMVVLWVLGSAVLAWASVEYDNIRYGTPRTYQTDAVVGHGGDSKQHPSHFIAVNLNRQAVIIELMAGNPANSISYVVPNYITGQSGDLTPITLEFRDVTGDSKPDMIVHVHLAQEQLFVFVNTGTKFRPPTSSDNIHL